MTITITTDDLEPTQIALTNHHWHKVVIYLDSPERRPLQSLIGNWLEELDLDMQTEFAGANPDSDDPNDTAPISDYFWECGRQPHRRVIPWQWQSTLAKAADRAGTHNYADKPENGVQYAEPETAPVDMNAIDDSARRLLGEEIAYSNAEPSPQY